MTVSNISHSGVMTQIRRDALRREVARIDGRGNVTRTVYDSLGRVAATIDALKNATTYAYDAMNRVAAIANALGDATVYEYDHRGNKTYEGGATYPVRYTYDVYGNKTTMTTYRHEPDGGGVGHAALPAPGDTDEFRGNLYLYVNNDSVGAYDRYGLLCCKDFLNRLRSGRSDVDPYDIDYYHLIVQIGVASIPNKDKTCNIQVSCKVCKSDVERSEEQSYVLGKTRYEKRWLDILPTIKISMCTDESGKLLGDEGRAKEAFKHELIHAHDMCKLGDDFSCGDGTASSIRNKEYDNRICSEIHAYAKPHLRTPGLSEEKIKKRVVDSIYSGCGLNTIHKPVHDGFGDELEKRIDEMYLSCLDGPKEPKK